MLIRQLTQAAAARSGFALFAKGISCQVLTIMTLSLLEKSLLVEIDHEIISKVILLPSAESFKNGCCQLQAKVC